MCARPRNSAAKPAPRETTDAFTAAYNAHDLSVATGLYRPDVVFVAPDDELKGREQVGEYLRAFLEAFPDGMVEVLARHDSGDSTIDEWVFHGTHTGPLPTPTGETIPPTGARVSVRGVDIQTHESGGIAAHHTYFDQVQFLTQLGLLPGPRDTAPPSPITGGLP
jgi:uncharacterized protein (TIGR02246 family)